MPCVLKLPNLYFTSSQCSTIFFQLNLCLPPVYLCLPDPEVCQSGGDPAIFDTAHPRLCWCRVWRTVPGAIISASLSRGASGSYSGLEVRWGEESWGWGKETKAVRQDGCSMITPCACGLLTLVKARPWQPPVPLPTLLEGNRLRWRPTLSCYSCLLFPTLSNDYLQSF